MTSVTAAAMASALALPATAEQVGFYDPAIPQCFSRTYDAAYMSTRPKQKVTSIAFMTVPAPLIQASDGRLMFQYTIAATMIGIESVMSNPGVCYEGRRKDQLICEAEGDGGVFTLTQQPGGKLRLDNPAYISVINDEAADADAEKEFVHILNADDQANFLLAPATDGLCQSDTAP